MADWWDSLTVGVTNSKVPKEPGQKDSLQVGGLVSDTLYYVGVVVLDGVGNQSALSNVVSARTRRDPHLVVTPDSLGFGDSQTGEAFKITNGGAGMLSWTVAANRTWITVNPAGGTTGTEEDTVRVTVDRTGLAPGDYSGTVTVVPSEGDSEHVTVKAEVKMARRALVLAQVHDTSGSMAARNAISYLRNGAITFTNFFDDARDKMTLVRYASGRKVLFPLGYDFKGPITSAIATFQAAGATTAEDALAVAVEEILSDPRPEAYRAIVFFTDGRPTSFRETFRIGDQDVDGVIGGYTAPEMNGGRPPPWLFNPTEINQALPYATPSHLPDGRTATTSVVLSESRLRTLLAANVAREESITIFAIGLGDPNADYWNQPDVELLVEVANVPSAPDPFSSGTIVNDNHNPEQPEGAFYFATAVEELEEVLGRVAEEIASRCPS